MLEKPNCDTIVIGGEKGFVKVQHLTTHRFSNLTDSSADTPKPRITEELEAVSGLDPSILQLSEEFSGKWRGGNRFVTMTTEDWLSQPFDGPRLGPRTWLPDRKTKNGLPVVPLVHETSEISRDGRRFYSEESPEILTKVDHLLMRFTHSQALSAVTRSRMRVKSARRVVYMQPKILLRLAIGVIRELTRRDTLSAAVAGRTVPQIVRLLRFVRRNVWRKESAATCLALYHSILDVYSAEELNSIPEFAKVNDVLRTCSENTQALAAVISFLQLPTPSQMKKKNPFYRTKAFIAKSSFRSPKFVKIVREKKTVDSKYVPSEKQDSENSASKVKRKSEKLKPKRPKIL
ncbi:unnamed protein product [Echinostoma caproni]|uniref:UTP15_C domain-containing protein n=1 Tax=Echinostoma caproni TaxID=27848 RepID=A0A183AW51_9TREM|nr:unnamed protein product [Echinostoma caproni]